MGHEVAGLGMEMTWLSYSFAVTMEGFVRIERRTGDYMVVVMIYGGGIFAAFPTRLIWALAV